MAGIIVDPSKARGNELVVREGVTPEVAGIWNKTLLVIVLLIVFALVVMAFLMMHAFSFMNVLGSASSAPSGAAGTTYPPP